MKPLHAETVLYRSPSLAVVDYRCRRPAERHPSCEEEAPSHQISLPRGGLFLKHQQDEVVLADVNHAVFFNCGEVYRVRHPVAGGDRCTVLLLDRELLLSAIAEVDPTVAERPDHPFRFSHGPASAAVAKRHYRLLARLADGRDELEAEELASRLAMTVIAEVYCHHGRHLPDLPASGRRQRALVDAAREILAADCGRRLGLGELAAQIGCSPSHLSRIFHRRTGTPLHRYRLQLRLRTALERLAAGDGGARADGEGLTDLALELGFFDHSHFTNVFCRELGLPPSTWRRLYRRPLV